MSSSTSLVTEYKALITTDSSSYHFSITTVFVFYHMKWSQRELRIKNLNLDDVLWAGWLGILETLTKLGHFLILPDHNRSRQKCGVSIYSTAHCARVRVCFYTCAVNQAVPAIPGFPGFEQKSLSPDFESSASSLWSHPSKILWSGNKLQNRTNVRKKAMIRVVLHF